jgi:hypothetical protein
VHKFCHFIWVRVKMLFCCEQFKSYCTLMCQDTSQSTWNNLYYPAELLLGQGV